MIESFWPRFVLAVLATWRVTHLLAREDGPGDVLVGLRARLGRSLLGQLMDCFYCLSLWVAAPLALVVSSRLCEAILIWPALTGAACLLERIGPQASLVIEPAQKGNDDGMLRSETRSAATGADDESAHGVTGS